MRKHDRRPPPEGPDAAALEQHIDQLQAELERQRRESQDRARLDAVTAALIGELDPARVLEVAERWVTATLGRPCTVVRRTAKARIPELPAGSSGLCVPLPSDEDPWAWLCMGGPLLTAEERVLAEELTARVSRALTTALRERGRTEGFRTLERSLLPDALLPLPGLQLASRYLPARGAHDVGGDFYDAVRQGDRITLIVGDVQGKGVEAATLTSLARHTLRAGALAGGPPGELLAQLNTALLYGQSEQLQSGQDPLLRFVTAAVASLERAGDGFAVRVARAGQPPPIIVRGPGEVEQLEPKGVLLGVTQRPAFEEATAELAVGDTLVLYTDGVIEQRDASRSFSEKHLGLLVRNRRSVVDAEAVAQLIEDTVHLVAPENVRDDVAILVACAVPVSR